MIRNTLKLMLLGSTLLATGSVAFAEDVTLTVESWRNDDLQIWQEKSSRRLKPSIRASRSISHQAHQRNIMPRSMPSFDAGSGGDLIACRPFDTSLELFNKGKLADLTDLEGMKNFSDVAKSAWTTDDGSKTFCVPMASVIHGFIYNQ